MRFWPLFQFVGVLLLLFIMLFSLVSDMTDKGFAGLLILVYGAIVLAASMHKSHPACRPKG
jgi:hypothetical protein